MLDLIINIMIKVISLIHNEIIVEGKIVLSGTSCLVVKGKWLCNQIMAL